MSQSDPRVTTSTVRPIEAGPLSTFTSTVRLRLRVPAKLRNLELLLLILACGIVAFAIVLVQLGAIGSIDPSMLLIGAGQLAEYLATMALFSGFTVTVCDPRIEYTRGWSVPGATVVTDMPDDAVTACRPDRRTCIVALSHDPKLDDLALMEALESDAFYVGAIGSRRNQDARRRRLIQHFELSEAAMDRLRGPVGIFIGSKTPSEIAVSIMAEIIAVKNGIPVTKALDVRSAKDGGLALAGLTDPACLLPER